MNHQKLNELFVLADKIAIARLGWIGTEERIADPEALARAVFKESLELAGGMIACRNQEAGAMMDAIRREAALREELKEEVRKELVAEMIADDEKVGGTE